MHLLVLDSAAENFCYDISAEAAYERVDSVAYNLSSGTASTFSTWKQSVGHSVVLKMGVLVSLSERMWPAWMEKRKEVADQHLDPTDVRLRPGDRGSGDHVEVPRIENILFALNPLSSLDRNCTVFCCFTAFPYQNLLLSLLLHHGTAKASPISILYSRAASRFFLCFFGLSHSCPPCLCDTHGSSRLQLHDCPGRTSARAS